MENFEEQGVELEAQRKSILKHLEDKQTYASKLADEYDEKYKSVMKILDQLRAGEISRAERRERLISFRRSNFISRMWPTF